MSRHFLLRLLESFFRRWTLYLVPVLVLSALGVAFVSNAKDSYVSTGVMYADSETLLSRLTAVRNDNGSGFQTPASLTAEQMNSILQSQGFVLTVAEKAGLMPALQNGTQTVEGLRSAVSVFPTGFNLVQVRAATEFPEVSLRLATATIESFTAFVVEANLSESASAESFFGELVTQYEVDVEAARADLDGYLRENPDPVVGLRPALEQAEISRLTSVAETADNRYAGALGNLENARLATAQTRGDVAQRLKLVDIPQLPVAPQGSLKAKVLSLGLFVTLGLLLSGAAVVAGSLIDRSVRTSADVTERLRTVVLAELPEDKSVAPFEVTPAALGR